jgi:DNA modification methylase
VGEIYAKSITLVKLTDIKLNPKNRNTHPADQIDRLVLILKENGFRRPGTISNRTGFLVCGEGRYLAAKKLGLKEMPVMYQDYESAKDELADAVADNAIDKWATLDQSGIMQDVKEFDDFNLDRLGIKDFKIVDPQIEPQCDEDEMPEHVEPITKLGDIYQLGRHRLMCGDSTSIDAVEKLMDGEKVDMVFTDPPYNLGFKYNSHDDNMSADEYKDFCTSWFNCLKTVTDKIIVTPGTKNIPMWMSIDPNVIGIACWVKKNWITSCYISNLQQWEPILFYGPFERSRPSDLYEINRSFQKDVGDKHTCPKQIELLEDIFNHYGEKSILDVFGGSGSTLIACEKTNRKCFMMELDPHYCDVIVARWEKYTGQKASRLEAD